jgi:hypothetical protein
MVFCCARIRETIDLQYHRYGLNCTAILALTELIIMELVTLCACELKLHPSCLAVNLLHCNSSLHGVVHRGGEIGDFCCQ